MVLSTPPPGRGITASRWRFGRVSRCSAYCTKGQPGTVCREGDKSEEAVPRQWLTFNPLQVFQREIESAQGQRIPSWDPIRCPENLRKFHLPGVFAFLGQRNQLIQCYPRDGIE
jgi:hypothetical protein